MVVTETIPGTLVRWEMVRVPAPPGGKPFWIARTETTWDAFDIFAFGLDKNDSGDPKSPADAVSRPSKPYGAPDRGWGHQGYPALAMTYASAEAFCDWLSKKTGKKYRLPTEAEWEFAARAGQKSDQPLTPAELDKVAWYWDNAEDQTHAAGSKAANAWGLHDMLGNVWEWCTGKDGKPVVRGGSFDSKAADVSPAARTTQTPAWNATDPQNPKSKWWLANAPFVGFRIVREE